MKFNLYLKDKKATTTLIYLFISYNGERIKFSLGLNVPVVCWDSKRNEVKSNYPDYKFINDSINIKSNAIKEKFYKLSSLYPEYTLKELKELYEIDIRVQSKLLGDTFQSLLTIIDSYSQYIESSKSVQTLKNVKSLKLHLIEFNKINPISISKIDKSFIDKFLVYFSNQKLGNNYYYYTMKRLKTILNWSYERGLHNYNNYKTISFRNFIISKDEIETFSLTIDEFKRILELELKEKHLSNARDTFIFACLTGQRYKDYKNNLSKNDIDGNFWRLKQEKTNTLINIPLNETAMDILKKYEYNLPITSNQKINDALKVIGERAEVNKLFTKIRKSGNKVIKEIKPKFEFLSFHDSRRTFISISDELGMNPEIIRQISGHKTYSEFKKYLNIDEDRIKSESGKWNEISKIGAL